MARYRRVMTACCLDEDVERMPAGDSTEIGEQGHTISGGQRARCGLARALFSDAQLVLLDDVTRYGGHAEPCVLSPQGTSRVGSPCWVVDTVLWTR